MTIHDRYDVHGAFPNQGASHRGRACSTVAMLKVFHEDCSQTPDPALTVTSSAT
jgi:hypothetical protein